MKLIGKEVLICNCEGTMPLAEKTWESFLVIQEYK